MKFTRRDAIAAGAAGAAAAAASPASGAKGHAMDSLLDQHDATGLAELVRKRQISPSELLDLTIARAEALNPRFNFMAQKHYDYARRKIADGLPAEVLASKDVQSVYMGAEEHV